MPSMDNSLLALGRLNLNESEVISHLCSVAVEKCQDRAERRRAGCGGQAMRKRVLIKNFVAELIRKQQEQQLEEEIDAEEEEQRGRRRERKKYNSDNKENMRRRGSESDEEEEEEEEEEEDDAEDEMNASMIVADDDEEDEEDEVDEEISAPTQVPRREWYHQQNSSHPIIPSSPSPPLDEDDKERGMDQPLWSLPPSCPPSNSASLLPSSPTSMALHLRDPYDARDYQHVDPYATASSSYYLSPPPEDDPSSVQPWHETHDGCASYLPRPPSRLSNSPPPSIYSSSMYDDFYSSSSSSSVIGQSALLPTLNEVEEQGCTMAVYSHFDSLLDPCLSTLSSFSSIDSSSSSHSVSSSDIIPSRVEDADTAFLASQRPLAEMKSYSVLDDVSRPPSDNVLFDLSSAPLTSSPSKKRRSDESPTLLLCTQPTDLSSKRMKL